MDKIKQLISTAELKTTLLSKLAAEKSGHIYIKYDDVFDALMLLVVSPERETVVHYMDDHVALLYLPATLEIVGLQVEDFEYSFVPQHEAVSRVWRLSDSGVKLESFGDVILAIEKAKPEVAREVVKATEHILGESASELEAILA